MPEQAFTITIKPYEALGWQLVLEEQIEDEGALLDQVAYGWRDASELLSPRV